MKDPLPPSLESARHVDIALAQEIALEAHTGVDVVQRVYQEEFDALAARAKVTQFLGILAGRRVRLRLHPQ